MPSKNAPMQKIKADIISPLLFHITLLKIFAEGYKVFKNTKREFLMNKIGPYAESTDSKKIRRFFNGIVR